MNLYISIINYNSISETKNCLRSIEELILPKELRLFVVVLDNGSNEFNLKKEDFKLNLEIIVSKENLGFSGGHNLIIKKIKDQADFILILNNDTILDKKLVERLINSLSDGVGIVSPKIYFSGGREFHKDRYKKSDEGKVIWYAGGIMDWKTVIGKHKGVDEVDVGQFERSEQIDFASGCCMMIRKEALEKVGLFDEKYFLYYEDADLSERFKRCGYKIMFIPEAVLWHNNASSSGGSGSSLQDYYITRNRLLFGMKFAPIKIKIFLTLEAIKTIKNGREWQKKGINDFFRGRFGKGSYV